MVALNYPTVRGSRGGYFRSPLRLSLPALICRRSRRPRQLLRIARRFSPQFGLSHALPAAGLSRSLGTGGKVQL